LGLVVALHTPISAQQKVEAQEKEVFTKGEAVQLLSATDFVKKKIGELLSWTIWLSLR
jgi:hypothetical protein